MGSLIRSATEQATRSLALVLALTLALGPAQARGESAAETKSRALYKDAMKAYDVGDFERALTLYSDAYKLAPLPGFLFNIAQCHRQLGNFEQAAFFYGRFIDNSKPQASNMEMATQLLGEMKTRQAEKAAAAQKKVDDEARQAEDARKDEARRADELKKPADAPKVSTLVPAPSELPPPPPPPLAVESPVYERWWFWTLIGIAVVGAAAGTTAGVVASAPKQQPARVPDLKPDLGSH